MSFTQAEHVFAGIHEDALNDLVRAFFTARPRHLRYGSTNFVPATSVSATHMDSIPFPGIPGGIDWAVTFEIPVVDLHKQNVPLPPELTLEAGHLSVRTVVELCLGCRHEKLDPRPPDPDRKPDDQRTFEIHPTCGKLEIFAVGHLEDVFASNNERAVVVAVDAVEIVDVAPNELESVLECLILMVLRAVLNNVRLPLRALRAGAFNLTIQRGPEVEESQVKIYGTV
jgi:hypothetical protein